MRREFRDLQVVSSVLLTGVHSTYEPRGCVVLWRTAKNDEEVEIVYICSLESDASILCTPDKKKGILALGRTGDGMGYMRRDD